MKIMTRTLTLSKDEIILIYNGEKLTASISDAVSIQLFYDTYNTYFTIKYKNITLYGDNLTFSKWNSVLSIYEYLRYIKIENDTLVERGVMINGSI